MEVKVVEHSLNTLKLEIVGKTHTLCNALCHELDNDKDVVAAGYQLEHPLLSNAVLVVNVKKGNPVQACEKAISRLMSKNKEFLEKFNAVL